MPAYPPCIIAISGSYNRFSSFVGVCSPFFSNRFFYVSSFSGFHSLLLRSPIFCGNRNTDLDIDGIFYFYRYFFLCFDSLEYTLHIYLVGMVGTYHAVSVYPCGWNSGSGWTEDYLLPMVHCMVWITPFAFLRPFPFRLFSLFPHFPILVLRPDNFGYHLFCINPFSPYQLAKQLSLEEAICKGCYDHGVIHRLYLSANFVESVKVCFVILAFVLLTRKYRVWVLFTTPLMNKVVAKFWYRSFLCLGVAGLLTSIGHIRREFLRSIDSIALGPLESSWWPTKSLKHGRQDLPFVHIVTPLDLLLMSSVKGKQKFRFLKVLLYCFTFTTSGDVSQLLQGFLLIFWEREESGLTSFQLNFFSCFLAFTSSSSELFHLASMDGG